MQYSNSAFLKKDSIVAYAGYFLKVIILVAIVGFIVLKLSKQPELLTGLVPFLVEIIQKHPAWIWMLPLVLSPVNWVIEALKWQFLVAKIEKVSFLSALEGVLTGLSIGFVTPHAVGDYAGRIWQLKKAKRTESLGAIMLGRAMQYFATFTFGIFGAGYFFFYGSSPHFYWISLLSILAIFFVGLIVIITLRSRFLSLLDVFHLSRFKPYFDIIEVYSTRDIIIVIGFAFLRYTVFVFQFFALLYLFEISSDWLFLLAGISWTFLAKSSVPAFNFLSDLGVREASALFFFSAFPTNDLHVVLASFVLWFINILLPALLGLVGVLQMKIFRKS